MSYELSNENQIKMFFHCGKCMDKRPENVTPMDWARTQTGATPQGIQVWCNRCDCNVVHIDFEGVKHPANCTRLADENGK